MFKSEDRAYARKMLKKDWVKKTFLFNCEPRIGIFRKHRSQGKKNCPHCLYWKWLKHNEIKKWRFNGRKIIEKEILEG